MGRESSLTQPESYTSGSGWVRLEREVLITESSCQSTSTCWESVVYAALVRCLPHTVSAVVFH